MNKIVDKFLLAGDKFMSKLHLRKTWFTYSVFEPLLDIVKKLKNSKEEAICPLSIKAI